MLSLILDHVLDVDFLIVENKEAVSRYQARFPFDNGGSEERGVEMGDITSTSTFSPGPRLK